MDIAITNPTTWPRVRRGVERFIHDLARYLDRQGHRVTILSGKPGAKEIIWDGNCRTILYRRLWHPSFAKAGLLEFHPFFATILFALLRERFDLVVSCTFTDASAACLARSITGTPSVFWVNGLPHRIRYVRSLTLKGSVFRRAMQAADEVVVLSSYMQQELAERFERSAVILPPGVDTDHFRLSVNRDPERPVILCIAALDDLRKGGRILMRAFDQLKRYRSSAILQISAGISETKRQELMSLISPEWRKDIQFLGLGTLPDLPGLLGRAAISVLPSRWEPFGMVVTESLATGTPVVGSRDGAIPEIITDDRVGRLFAPGPASSPEPSNVDGLVHAMLEGMDLSRDPQTAYRCREHIRPYSWAVMGPRYEKLFRRVGNSRKKAVAGAA